MGFLFKMEKINKTIDFRDIFCYNTKTDLRKSQSLEEIFMLSRDVTIVNNVGLHARPATFFIQKANSYKATIWLEEGGRRINAKSLLGVLSMGIVKGTSITLISDGADEEEALNGLTELITTGLND